MSPCFQLSVCLCSVCLTPALTLRMALGIVSGVDHLHTAVESCLGKAALAHCDLKSKNVLVKADLACCVGDLGLALSGDRQGRVTLPPHAVRTGTKRYMAPEVLARSLDFRLLLHFQRADMYSLALVLWELLSNTTFTLHHTGNQSLSITITHFSLSLSKHILSKTNYMFVSLFLRAIINIWQVFLITGQF